MRAMVLLFLLGACSDERDHDVWSTLYGYEIQHVAGAGNH